MCRSLTTIAAVLAILVGCVHGYEACPSGYDLIDGHCFKVSLDYLTMGSLVTYEEAKAQCQESLNPPGGWNSNLVVLETSEKLQALGRHIYQDLPKRVSGLVFWVGGEKLQSQWKWVNGIDMNLRSHIWLPQQPQQSEDKMRMYIVPADPFNERFYATAYNYTVPGVLPSYVCEAMQ